MSNKRKPSIFACDFETVVDDNTKEQEETAVWSAAYAKLYSEEQNILHSIEEFMMWVFSCPDKSIFYFHNLKFDGFFILDYLLNGGFVFNHVKKPWELENKEFDCIISGDGRFYTLTVKYGGFVFFFRDSLKLLPFRLDQIGKAFDLKHKKLKMDYKGNHYPNCPITAEEAAYIINDVLCLKEALEIMFGRGMKKLTIGANCMQHFKKGCRKKLDFKNVFRNLKNYDLLPEQWGGFTNADEYIRKSYRGGWCYLKPEYANRWVNTSGKTFDVNSLYPSVMHSISGNYYPVGEPHFFKKKIPPEALEEGRVFFIRCKIIGNIKKGCVPTIQVKNNLLYRPTSWLESTDIWYDGEYHKYYYDTTGVLRRAELTLTLTKPDLELLKGHYLLEKFEILDGCWFYGQIGLFDEYIDYWMGVKINAKSKVERTIAKLMLNNLYGKFATSDDSSYMVPVLNDGIVGTSPVQENEKQVVNIAVGSMVTAYARYFTISHAQMNYDRFIYADTDSLHCLDDGNVYHGIIEDDKALLTWKNESDWTRAKFIRQKTYCEFIRKEDSEKVKPYWNIKCAGMPESCKRKFLDTHPINDFNYGLTVSGKLRPKHIKGGIVLVEDEYSMTEYKEKSLKKWLQKYDK